MVIRSDEAPDTNQDAYKTFVAPKTKEYKFPEISQKDISDFVTKLESKDSKDL